ncbi:MAG: Gfo/Idh/MocA family protein [Chromatiales bacterium]
MKDDSAAVGVRFGVIGCSDIGWRRTMPAMLSEPETTLVAVGSRSRDKAARFAERFGCDAESGYQEVLDRDDINAIYIPLPVMQHGEWVERALLADKHVLVEKPMTDSHRRATELTRLAGSRGLVLMENFMFLHHSQHAAAAKLLADGAIGEMRSFHSAFTIPPKPPGDIRYQPTAGGGAVLDIGVYPIRAAMYFRGPELRFLGGVLRKDKNLGVVLSGCALFASPDGVPAQANFGMEQSYRTSYELSGSTGRLSMDRVFTPPDTFQPVVRIERQDHQEEIVLPADAQFVNILGAFARTVLHGVDITAYTESTLRLAWLIDQVIENAEVIEI